MSETPSPGAGRARTLRPVALFVVLVLAIAYTAPLLGGDPTSPGPGFILWGAAPLLVALLLRIFSRDWADLGIRLGLRRNGRWYLLSLLVIPAVMALTLLIGVATSMTTITGFSAAPYAQVVAIALVAFLVTGLLEEFGWRGYLAPKIAMLGINPYLGHAMVGVVWATWHLPFLAGFGWMFGDESLTTMIPRFYLSCIALSIVYGEIRAITGTFWPAVLMHAAGNAVGHPLAADSLHISRGSEYLGSISTSIIATTCFALIGIGLHQWRSRQSAS